MDFIKEIRLLGNILKEACESNYTIKKFEDILQKFLPEDDDDISPLITKLHYLHTTTKEMRDYLNKLYPYISKSEHIQNCNVIGATPDFFLKMNKNDEPLVYADYPDWLTYDEDKNNFETDDKNMEDDYLEHFNISDPDGGDTSGVAETLEEVVKEMICIDTKKFKHTGPKNGKINCKNGCFMLNCICIEGDDWFTKKCRTCDLSILHYTHSIRYPLEKGGWKNCYCSMKCMINDSHFVEYNFKMEAKFELMYSQLKEIKILDKYIKVDINQEKYIDEEIIIDDVECEIPVIKLQEKPDWLK